MRGNLIYIHVENISHMALTYGVTTNDFVTAMRAMNGLPQNLLLLSPVDANQEIDINTGFNIVTGQNSVHDYLSNKQNVNMRWLDFDDQHDLEQLTPIEIAGMLYLGHAYMHMQSPFYYKLQNQYVFLTLPNGALKVYYRHMKQLDRVLAYSFTSHVATAFREKRRLFFLQRPLKFALFPFELSQKLHVLYSDGAVFNFNGMKVKNGQVTVPILVAPDTIYQVKWHEPTMLVERSRPAANLIYSLKSQEWKLEVTNQELFTTQYL